MQASMQFTGKQKLLVIEISESFEIETPQEK
jgi:hypothetical protein